MEFRGKVTEVRQNGAMVVNLEEETVLECSLSDFLPTNNQWTTSALDMLKKLVLNKTSTGTVHRSPGRDTGSSVQLYSSPERSQSVSQLLCEAGHGQTCIIPQFARTGESSIVYTSCVTSEQDFWVQREDSTIQSMQEEMDAAYSNPSLQVSLTFEAIYPGVACVTKHDETGCFCRAEILSATPSQVEVVFVDYGDTQTCQPVALFPLVQQFSTCTAQAIQCTMGSECRGSLENFRHFVNNQRLSVQFKSEADKGTSLRASKWTVLLKNADTDESWSGDVSKDVRSTSSEGYKPSSPTSYERVTLKQGSTQSVYVIHSDNPDSIWVQLAVENPDLDAVMEGISRVANTLPRASVSVGLRCCAVSSIDSSWYRGEVRSVDQGYAQATVHFVDYGNQEVVSCDQITSLPDEFSTLPAQAVKVALSGIKPCDLYRGWYQETASVLHDLIQDKVLQCEVVAMDTTSGHPLVELTDTHSSNLNISNELAKRKLVFYSSSNLPSTTKEAVIPPLRPLLRTPVDVVISSSSSPVDFWVQLAENYESLSDLMSSMSGFYGNQTQTTHLSRDSLEVGNMCATKFSVDGVWYRAELTQVHPQIEVRFVDYGNSEPKQVEELYVLAPQFFELPAQAVPCTLADFKRPDSLDAAASMLEGYIDSQLIGIFQEVDENGGCQIQLVDTSTGSDQNIGVLLSAQGGSNITSVTMPTTRTPFQSYISYIESPSKFYIQFAKWESELNLLLEQMYEHYSTAQRVPHTVQPGSICAALFRDDENWYRSRVESLSQNNAKVFFIDYGNTVNTSVKDLQPLEAKFTKLPSQVLPCRLALKDRQEVPNARDVFQQHTADKQVQVTPTGELEGSTHLVNVSVADVNLIDVVTIQPKSGSRPSSTKGSPRRERAHVPYPCLSPDSTHTLFVVEWKSESAVACQFSDSTSDLDDLALNLNNFYSSPHHLSQPASVSVGDVVCVQYSVDQCWYRALVEQCGGHGDQFKVVYLDYGNEESVSLVQMRELDDKFRVLPALSIVCCFSSPVKPELLKEEELKVKVVKQTGKRQYSMQLVSEGDRTQTGDVDRTLSGIPMVLNSIPDTGYIDIQVTYSVSPLLFYCQKPSFTEHLKKLVSQLNDHCDNLHPHTTPSVGEICVAKFSQDDCWYRALVEVVDSHLSTVKVFFVDYGNNDTVPFDNLRRLPLEFSYLPQQAIPCTLSGIKAPSGGWSEEIANTFDNLVVEKSFVAEIKGKESDPSGQPLLVVELLDGDVLVKEQFLVATKGLTVPEYQTGRKKHPSVSLMPYPPLRLDLKRPHLGEVTHVEDPFSFYIQPFAVEKQLEVVNEIVEKTVLGGSGRSSGDIPVLDLRSGAPCLAQYSVDQLWYRGLVKERFEAPNQKWKVTFVDFGNTETITSPADIQRCPPNLLSIENLSLHCSLRGVAPSLGSRGWSRQAVDSFREVLLNKEVELSILEQEGPLSRVTLKLSGGDVAESFIKSGFATSVDDTPSDGITDNVPSEDLYLSTPSTLSQIDTNSSVQSSSHQSSDAGDVATGTRTTTLGFSYPSPPAEGATMKVIVSFAESPASFYCQDVEHADELNALMFKLDEYCSSIEPGVHGVLLPGQPCGAKYSQDGGWYRAEVLELKENGKVLVQYVDYGNSEAVDASLTVSLPPHLVSLPGQAFWCSTTSDFERQFNQSEIDGFVTAVTEQEFELTVKAADGDSLVVALVDSSGNNVTQTFVHPTKPMGVVGTDTPPTKLHFSYPDPPSTGVSMNVIITYISSPLDFYCQNVSLSATINNVMDQLHTYCTTAKPTPGPYEVGQPVGALYSADGTWYRGEIIEVQTSAGTATVQYVDYGNFETVQLNDLRPLCAELVTLPPQAMWCSLSDNFDEVYSSSETDLFKNFIEKEFLLVVKKVEGDSIVVGLKDESGEVSLKGGSNVATAPVKEYTPVSEAALGLTYPTPPPKGGKMAVLVTHVNSPCDFYCVPASETESLDKLTKELSLYANSPSSTAVKFVPHVGDTCVAMFSEDGEWYRGEVNTVEPDGHVVVQFVDYGNTGTVDADHILPLKPQHVAMPTKAYWCSITDNLEQVYSQSEVDHFKNLVLDQEFEMEVCSSTVDSLTVKLYDASGKEVSLVSSEKKSKEELFFVSPSTLPKGTTLPVFVTHAVSPADFHLQVVADTTPLDTLMAELSDYCNGASRNGLACVVGEPCAAVSSLDGGWYRAEILEVHSTTAKVSFIDYGNSEEVDISCLRPLQPRHLQLPTQGYWCSVTSNFDCQYSESECASFVESVTECEFTMTVLHSEGDSYVVQLMDGNGSVLFENFQKEPSSVTDKEDETTLEPTPKEEPPQVLPSTEEIVEERSICVYPSQQQLTPGCRLQVEVTHAISPANFYCQDLANTDVVRGLQEQLTAHCSAVEKMVENVQIGQPYAARSEEDNCWYRSEIARQLQDGSVEVFYVDWGNSEIVPVSNLKPLPPDQLTHPPMAYWCSLTSNFEQDFGEDDVEQFVSTLTGQVFELTVRKTLDQTLIVSVWDEEGCPVGSVFSDPRERIDVKDDMDDLDELPSQMMREGDYAIGNIDYAKTNVFKWPLKAEIGEKVEVFVSFVESPLSFYCQPLHLAAELEEIMSSAAELLEGVDPIPVDRVKEGVICGSRFSQGEEWYRAVVEEVLPDANQVCVRYIDYGNKEVLPSAKLVELPQQLLSYRAQVIHCSCGQADRDLYSSDKWEELKVVFDGEVSVGGRFVAAIQKEIARGKYFVHLCNEDGKEIELPSNQEQTGLIHVQEEAGLDESEREGLADGEVEELTQQLVVEEQRQRRTLQDTLDVEQGSSEGVDNFQSLPSPPVKEKRKMKEDTSEDSDDDDSSVESSGNSPVVPFKLNFGVKEVLTVKVSAVESPSVLFLQRSDCASELEALMVEIRQYTVTTKGTESQEGAFYTPSSPPKKGDFVLANPSTEDTWHRGEICEDYNPETNTCVVYFVDYGFTREAPLHCIQFCPPMLLMLPQQAIMCCLADVPRREAWPEEYTDLILSFVASERYLQAEVALPSVEGMRPNVRLKDISTGADLSKIILEHLDKECDGEEYAEEEEKMFEEEGKGGNQPDTESTKSTTDLAEDYSELEQVTTGGEEEQEKGEQEEGTREKEDESNEAKLSEQGEVEQDEEVKVEQDEEEKVEQDEEEKVEQDEEEKVEQDEGEKVEQDEEEKVEQDEEEKVEQDEEEEVEGEKVEQDEEEKVEQDEGEKVEQDEEEKIEQDEDEKIEQDKEEEVEGEKVKQDEKEKVEQDEGEKVEQDEEEKVEQDEGEKVEQDEEEKVEQDKEEKVEQVEEGKVEQDEEEKIEQDEGEKIEQDKEEEVEGEKVEQDEKEKVEHDVVDETEPQEMILSQEDEDKQDGDEEDRDKQDGDEEDKDEQDGNDEDKDEQDGDEEDSEEWYDVDEPGDEEGEMIGYDPSEYSVSLPDRIKFGPNMTMMVQLATVHHPHSIFCHPIKQRSKLDRLMENLNTFYNNLRPFDFNLTDEPEVGEVVCVPSWDDEEEDFDTWYRARVIEVDYSWEEDYPIVKAECVDFGTKEDVALEDVRRLAKEFANDAPFGLECSLSGIESPSEDGQYSERCLEYLNSFAELDEAMVMKILQVLGDNRYEVTMTTADDRSINQALVDGGFARSTDGSHVTKPLTPPTKTSSQTTVAEDTPATDLDTPSNTGSQTMETDTPTVEADMPTVETGTPTVEMDTPTVETDTPIVDQTVEMDTPIVETDTPTVETDTPTVETDTPTVKRDLEEGEYYPVEGVTIDEDSHHEENLALKYSLDAVSVPGRKELLKDSPLEATSEAEVKDRLSPSNQTDQSNVLAVNKSVVFTKEDSRDVVNMIAEASVDQSVLLEDNNTCLQSLEQKQEDAIPDSVLQGDSWHVISASDNPSFNDCQVGQYSQFQLSNQDSYRRGFHDSGMVTRQPMGLSKSLQSSPTPSPLHTQPQMKPYSLSNSPRHVPGPVVIGNNGGYTSPSYMSVGVSSFDPSTQTFNQGITGFFPSLPQSGPSNTQTGQGVFPSMMFSPGDKVELVLISCDSPDNFICQPLGSQKALKLLMEEIEQHLKKHGLADRLTMEDIGVGTCVLVKYVQDGLWYRAEVTSIEGPDLIEVFFVDYGNVQQVSLEGIQPLPQRFSALARQGIVCSLAHVGPVETPEGWSVEAQERFSSLVMSEQFLQAAVVEVIDTASINLQIEVAGGIDLADKLVEEGLAAPRLSKL